MNNLPQTCENPAGWQVQWLESDVDLVALHDSDPQRYPHLLQSTARGRYDILFALPGDSLVLDAQGQLTGGIESSPRQHDFLTALDDCWRAAATVAGPGDGLPFTGGWFVYLGYELAQQIEPSLQLPRAADNLPVAFATRFRSALIRDHAQQRLCVVTESGQSQAMVQILNDIGVLPQDRIARDCAPAIIALREDEPGLYTRAVERIHRYIHEGDVFQVNLSRNWEVLLADAVSPVSLYKRLARHNPAPFAGLSSWGGVSIISSSPERLVRLQNGLVETRPIAGTRPRGQGATADKACSDELLAHPKERAEHIMLIDLERNDLGRLCVPGSIEVNELMALESYAHVHHIVSNVRGRVRAGTTPGEVIAAVFPGGTITGCPKVRCMEIIAELERQPRGAYTGSMGYINRDGSMDLNILIRTMVCEGDRLTVRAGAGIVADSEARAELQETRAKARGLLHALGLEAA